MTASLRALLIVCAFLVLFFIIRKLRKSQIQVMDSIFWLLFSFSLVVLAIFPEIAFTLSKLLGFQAPVNFVMLYVIAILVMRDFSATVSNAALKAKVTALIQEIALRDSSEREARS